MSPMIIADEWIQHLCETLGIPADRTVRIIIDAQAGHPVLLYVSLFGDERLLDLWPPEVEKGKIVTDAG